MKQDNNQEMFPIVDEQGNIISAASVVAFATGGGTDDVALFIHDGEHFLVIVLLHNL